jgi:UDP-glucose 4-epimerase
VFNVGSGEEISILGLAERVKAVTHSKSAIEVIPYERAYEKGFEDMFRRVPSTDKIRELVGWQPAHDLSKILDDVTAFERATID